MTDTQFARTLGWIMILASVLGLAALGIRTARERNRLRHQLECRAIGVPAPFCERLFPR
jgi:hypothetical protein